MKEKVNILNLQFEPFLGDKDRNLKKVAKLLKENKDFNPDVVILPEVWNIGLAYDKFSDEAEFIPDQTTMLLSGLAQENNTYIIAGSIIEKTFENQYFNTTLVFDRQGAFVGKYRKNHVFSHCGSEEAKYINSGDDICIIDIDGIKVGIAICYDIRFPELFRKMLKMGAQIFVVPAAFAKERIAQWNILNQARALENLAVLISCNQFGSSNIVSPYGEILASLPEGEGVLKYSLDTNIIIEARKHTPFIEDIKL